MTRAPICRISGQEDALPAHRLVEQDNEVVGTSRDEEMSRFDNLVRPATRDRGKCRWMALDGFRSTET